ncbi:hypothetical protein OPT61_g9064 [Boeremia exigua]|uniref:Uncharacterized protein n=1 Tax=Boeremia exigua TaxID=749465 RepID=A0ACC2HWI1_9PLEO|nr:hypothetical protein OPT61_g9064 [Boeremia exigua]
MDPLSIVGLTSSIVQLADASFKIMKILDTIKEGGKDRRRLCDEITVLWMVLRGLETQFAPANVGQDESWMKPVNSLAEPQGVFEQLHAALGDIQEKVTTSNSTAGKLKQTLRWPLDQSYVDRTVARVERLKSSIVLVTNQASIAVAKEMRADVSQVKQAVTDSQLKALLDWLSPLNCREKQSNITATPGTGGWFFNSKPFKGWTSGNNRWLWCHGIPGAGKTFLASNTVTELQQVHQPDQTLVLVLFCSYDTADTQSVDNLVASLLKQVVQSHQSVPQKLQDRYKEHSTAGTKPKLVEIIDILNGVLAVVPKTYIIIDALDELTEESKRTTILDIMYQLQGRPKIMVTSRQVESIASRFGTIEILCDGCSKESPEVYHHCEDCYDFDFCDECHRNNSSHQHAFIKRYSSRKIQITAHSEDVESYILRRIQVEEDLRGIIGTNHHLQDCIVNEIVDNAKEMFLLARFHMDALADCLTVADIESALSSLPQGIDNTYEQVMERITKLSNNRRRSVMRLLQWVSYSKRPLTIAELEHAIAITRGARELQLDNIISAKLLTSMSAGIVIVDENERIRLTHKTAEDYFLKRRATLFPDGDREITESCLAYLQLLEFESGPCGKILSMSFQSRLQKYPFYGYASLFWAEHARNCDSQIISPQALLFLRKRNLLESSVQALWYVDVESDDSWDVLGGVDALHLASYFGLDQIVEQLVDEGADVNVRDSLGTTPLIYACARGHAHVTETLLQAGALPHLTDHRGSTSLLGCVKRRRYELAKRILQEKDVAINALYTTFNYYTALMLAAWNSDPQMVRMILERPDVDVNMARPDSGGTCLLLATYDNEIQCVEELLRHPNINLNHQDNSKNTATHYAAMHGYGKILSLLLTAGADTERQDDHGGRPLQRAIDYGELGAVRTLLDHDADYTFKDMLGRTVLHAAAVNGQVLVLRYLLETCKNPDVNVQGNQGETALHDAARFGFIATTKVLLQFGARSDIKNKAGFTPVRLAQEKGWTDVLNVLRDAREQEIKSQEPETVSLRKANTFDLVSETSLATAVEFESLKALEVRIAQVTVDELNKPTKSFSLNALHCACEASRLEVVVMLLNAGAFVDPLDSFSRTPLILACQKGDFEIVQALVQHGADVNHAQFGNSTPWEIAWKRSRTHVALFLLSQPNIKIESHNRLLQSALGWAAALGELEACKNLVEAGAPLYLKNAHGMSPSQIANYWNQPTVEIYLLEQETERKMHPPEAYESTNHAEELSSIEYGMDTLDPPPATDDMTHPAQSSGVWNENVPKASAQNARSNVDQSHSAPMSISSIAFGILAALLAALLLLTKHSA